MNVLPKLGPVHALDHIEREGEKFMTQVAALGLEGLIAKRADSQYRGTRSDAWQKIKAERTADFVIVGYTEPKGSRSHFGALQLADLVGGALVYAGRAGTGFDETLLAEIGALLAASVRAEAPCHGPVATPGAAADASTPIPDTKTTTWVEPLYVCEVRFREWTPDGLLRHPTFLRMRADKDPKDCERQGWEPAESESAAQSARSHDPPELPPAQPVERTITFSNLKKIYWPAERYTKGDLIEYYRAISPWMLPYLRDRPLVMTRYPDGIEGKSFYQKDAPEFAPQWLRTVPIWSEDTQRDIRYFVCDNVESLLYIANLGSIPLHSWASRVSAP
jgi:bifunctional non-homologous end joining protein LigD